MPKNTFIYFALGLFAMILSDMGYQFFEYHQLKSAWVTFHDKTSPLLRQEKNDATGHTINIPPHETMAHLVEMLQHAGVDINSVRFVQPKANLKQDAMIAFQIHFFSDYTVFFNVILQSALQQAFILKSLAIDKKQEDQLFIEMVVVFPQTTLSNVITSKKSNRITQNQRLDPFFSWENEYTDYMTNGALHAD